MIHFILNDKEISTELPAGTTVLDFVRYHQHLTGTKIGCREGDCGACTVLIGELRIEEQKNKEQMIEEVVYRSMTSCLLPLANVHGKHVVTIEGINPPEGLNPIQQAMSDAGATQCGFCTPGFVVSLAGFCLNHQEPKQQNVIAAVDGNICRCTGYKSIERAASVVAEKIQAKTQVLPEYFSSIKNRLLSLNNISNPASRIPNPVSRIVSGGTDLYVQQPEELTHSQNTYVFNDPKHKLIRKKGKKCILGPAVTVTDLLESPLIHEIFPGFSSYAKLISSTPIRNMATLAGNFVNASPIGDFSIFFLALDAQLELRQLPKSRTSRTITLRSLYKGYKQLDKNDNEVITSISFEIPRKGHFFNFEKVSKRTHLDIASVNTAVSLAIEKKKIVNAGVTAGGVAPIPLYLQKTSGFLTGKEITDETIMQAVEMAKSEINPISDARGSKEYKTLLLGQLLKAHFIKYLS